MRNLLRLIVRYHFFFLFLLLEVLSIFIVVQKNNFQRAQYIGVTRSVQGFFFETFGSLRDYLELRQTNNDLFKENTLLRNRLDGLSRQHESFPVSRNDSIPGRQFLFIPATVINNSTNKQLNFITIDKGRLHGIEPEMAVIAPQGVVGVVYAVSASYSTILPVINRNFRLSAKIRRNNYFGSMYWPGLDYSETILEEIPFHVEIFPGDTIVTSGYSSIFPEGIMVGTVGDIEAPEGNFYTIRVNIAVDFKNIFYVNVIRNLLRAEQLELERISGND